jgi:hypothetical protein
MIVADGFYEFTKPRIRPRSAGQVLFTVNDTPSSASPACGARPQVGEAYTMLTREPGPDVAPYHNRGVAVLAREQWADWLDPAKPAAEVLRPLPEGSLGGGAGRVANASSLPPRERSEDLAGEQVQLAGEGEEVHGQIAADEAVIGGQVTLEREIAVRQARRRAKRHSAAQKAKVRSAARLEVAPGGSDQPTAG